MTKTPMNLFSLARSFNSLDHRKIAEWVAMNHPSVFLAAAEETVAPTHPAPLQWMLDCPRVLYPQGILGHKALFSLIKHIHDNTGLELQEALLVCRALTGSLTDEQTKELYESVSMYEARCILGSIRGAVGKNTL